MPLNGMIRAARALHYLERRQEVVSHNLANADTSGFKAERAFARALGDALPVVDTQTDRTAGTLQQTESPLDLALGGEGFFVVDTPEGERWTRSGSFRLDEAGRMVDANGNALLGEGGPIVLPQGRVEVNGAGRIRVEGKDVARIRIDTAPAGADLTHAGGNLFVPDAAGQPIAEEQRVVRQGYLETSNVNAVSSLVDMIEIQRAYSAVQRSITTMDQVRGTISNDLGKPV